MKRFAVLAAAALFMMSCSPDDEVTGSVPNKCVSRLYPAYNPKVMDQCVAACIRCERGTMTTCSTSCTLKGAH